METAGDIGDTQPTLYRQAHLGRTGAGRSAGGSHWALSGSGCGSGTFWVSACGSAGAVYLNFLDCFHDGLCFATGVIHAVCQSGSPFDEWHIWKFYGTSLPAVSCVVDSMCPMGILWVDVVGGDGLERDHQSDPIFLEIATDDRCGFVACLGIGVFGGRSYSVCEKGGVRDVSALFERGNTKMPPFPCVAGVSGAAYVSSHPWNGKLYGKSGGIGRWLV